MVNDNNTIGLVVNNRTGCNDTQELVKNDWRDIILREILELVYTRGEGNHWEKENMTGMEYE